MDFRAIIPLVSFFYKINKTVNAESRESDELSLLDNITSEPDWLSPAGTALFTAKRVLLLSLLVVIGLLNVGGNILVILCVALERSMRTVSYYLLASLSVADLFVGVFVMPMAAYLDIFDGRFPFSRHVCNLWLATDVTASTASILGLIAIAYNRYIAIVKPFSYAYTQKNTTFAFWLPFFCIWIVSAVIASPVVFGVNHSTDDFEGYCSFANVRYLFFSSIFSFFIPSVAMLLLYMSIFRKLAKLRLKRSRLTRQKMEKSSLSNIRFSLRNNMATPETSKRMCSRHYSVISHPNRRARQSMLATIFIRKHGSISAAKENLTEKQSNDPNRCSIYDDASGVYLGTTTPPVPSVIIDHDDEDEKSQSENASYNIKDALMNSRDVVIPMLKDRSTDSQFFSDVPTCSQGHDDSDPQMIALNKRKQGSTSIERQSKLPTMSKSTISKEKRITTMLVIVLVLFFVCWCPFFASNIINGICHFVNSRDTKICTIPDSLMKVFTWLGYGNSTMNPIVYAIFNLEFRRALRRLLLR